MEPAVVSKTAKLIRLLGSPQDGEALGAARGLARTLEGAGSSLHELADRVETGLVTRAEPRAPGFEWNARPPLTPKQMLDAIMGQRAKLRDKDAGFVADITYWIKQGRRLTPKQRDWLEDIYERVVEARF